MIDHHGEPADMAEITVAVEDLEETDLQEKCTQLHVQSVDCLLYTSDAADE